MIDYKNLTEEEFQDHCAALYAEQDRRTNLRDIPNSVQQLANSFEQLGGDKADLVAKINEPVVESENVNTDTPVLDES